MPAGLWEDTLRARPGFLGTRVSSQSASRLGALCALPQGLRAPGFSIASTQRYPPPAALSTKRSSPDDGNDVVPALPVPRQQ